ncbi:MAG: CocE/NonD family hydrolase [Clostridiales bacterium]|nr:CocE/NonD family hydrolase [Clostridiales bacterium]
MITNKNIEIKLSDNTTLMMDIYRPDSKKKVPSLICFSPYGKDVQALALERKSLRLGQVLFDQTIEVPRIDYFVENGYAVIVPSPRGVSTSEGYFTGMLSMQDQRDCVEIIEWTAKQDFSTENIGMIGTGYAGKIQPLVASHKPKYLKAIMPVEVTYDFYADCYWGGGITDHNFYYAGLVPAINPITEAELNNSEDDLKEMLKKCRELPQVKANSYFYRGLDMYPPRHYTWNIDILLQPKGSSFWSDRSMENKEIDIPMYIVSPYYEHGKTTISAINLYNSKGIKSTKKLMLSHHALNRKSPDDFTLTETLKWYDYHLKGIETGIEDEKAVKVFVMGKEKFRFEDTFPLKRSENVNLYLGKNSSLKENVSLTETSFDVLPHRPPTKVSQNFEDIPALTYTTSSLEKDTEVTGVITISIYASVDINKGNLIAKLWDLNPDGVRTHLSSGYLSTCYRGTKNSGFEYGIANDFDTELEVIENEIYKYEFELSPTSNVFKKGNKIQVEIKTMDKRAIVDNEKTSFAMIHPSSRVDGIQPITEFCCYKVYYGNEYRSCINLPIVYGREGTDI